MGLWMDVRGEVMVVMVVVKFLVGACFRGVLRSKEDMREVSP